MSKKRGPLTPKTKQVVLKMVISVDANGVGACELDTNGLTHNNDVNILALAEAQLGFRELTMARTIEETFGRDDAKQFLETIQKKTGNSWLPVLNSWDYLRRRWIRAQPFKKAND
jgi:hypothetical protein